jgi:hypothetical protein
MVRSFTLEEESATTCQVTLLSVSLRVNQIGQPTKVQELGYTEIPEDMFMELLRDISDRFTANTYNVLNNNCNNFTNEVSLLLLGQGIPQDIVDLPK